MKRCKFHDEDGDDYQRGDYACAHDPYRCLNFQPNKYFCPFMKEYDKKQTKEWRIWYYKYNMKRSLLRFFSNWFVIYTILIGLFIFVLWLIK
jgi:hypothetical protein